MIDWKQTESLLKAELPELFVKNSDLESILLLDHDAEICLAYSLEDDGNAILVFEGYKAIGALPLNPRRATARTLTAAIVRDFNARTTLKA